MRDNLYERITVISIYGQEHHVTQLNARPTSSGRSWKSAACHASYIDQAIVRTPIKYTPSWPCTLEELPDG